MMMMMMMIVNLLLLFYCYNNNNNKLTIIIIISPTRVKLTPVALSYCSHTSTILHRTQILHVYPYVNTLYCLKLYL